MSLRNEFNDSLTDSNLLTESIKSQRSVISDEILKFYLNEHFPDDFDRYINEFCRQEFDSSVVSKELSDSLADSLEKFIIDVYLHQHFPDDFDKQS